MNKEYKEDINIFFELYENNHPAPYYICSKKDINKYIEELFLKYDVVNDYDFQYIMRLMIKKLNGNLDPHTGIRFNKELNLPFQFKCFNNNLYVVNTIFEYDNLFGSRVISINNVPIDTLIKESEEAYSYNTEGWRKRGIARILGDVEGILMLPSINSNSKEIVIELEKLDKEIVIETFTLSELKNHKFSIPNYKYYIIDNSIVFKYSLCIEEYNGQMSSLTEEISKIVSEKNITKFILDLRDNTGGGSEYINPLVEYLGKSNLEKIVLTNGSVYSSAIIAIQKMEKIDSYFIGDEVGSTINHFGNLDCQSYLPNTGIKAVISTKYFGGNYVINNQDEFKKLNKKDLVIINYKPNIFIPETIEDYINGKDLILDAALQYNLKENIIK